MKPVPISGTIPASGCVKAEDAVPLMAAFKDSPDIYREFRIEQRVGKEIRVSTLVAQIVKIEEGPETRGSNRLLIPALEAALKALGY